MKCADVYNLFFAPGEVTEIRSYGVKEKKSKAWEGWAGGEGIVFGYFDNADAFGKAAEALDAANAGGVYFVLNPINPDLLARSANRLKAAGAKSPATTDKDILCLRWLYIDIDRPETAVKGISSNEEELEAAVSIRNKISKWLKSKGWGQGIPAMSGNGAHLLMRLPDLPNTDENKLFLKSCLAALGMKFNGEKAQVDCGNFNPSRICKLYGTTARKGDSTPKRPHRKSFIEPRYLEAK